MSNTVFEAGVSAARKGLLLNPYKHGTNDYILWEMGYKSEMDRRFSEFENIVHTDVDVRETLKSLSRDQR